MVNNMKYDQFSLLLKQRFNDISQKNIQTLWIFSQNTPLLPMQKVYDLYEFCEDITLKSLINLNIVINRVNSIINFFGYDTFDVLSFEKFQTTIYKKVDFLDSDFNLTRIEQYKILLYIKKVCMLKYKIYQNMKKNIRMLFANTLSFDFYDADVSLLEKNIQISEQLYNDLPFYLKITAISDENIDITEIILESYDVNDNLELSYQQRLNFILGYNYLSSDDLMGLIEAIFEFYQNKDIPNKCKDKCFLYGLLDNCRINLDTTNSNDEIVCEGKSYFMNNKDFVDDQDFIEEQYFVDDQEKSVLVRNINDYMHDLTIQEKNKKFLYGICLACIEESQKNSVKVYLKY